MDAARPDGAAGSPGAAHARSSEGDGAGQRPKRPADQLASIGDIAAAFGLTTRTIRFYESKKLISPNRRGKHRLYSRRERARLRLILRGKNLGFSLEEIREYLDLYDADPSLLMQTRHLLGKVEAAIAELVRKRDDIDRSLIELSEIRDHCIEQLKKTGR